MGIRGLIQKLQAWYRGRPVSATPTRTRARPRDPWYVNTRREREPWIPRRADWLKTWYRGRYVPPPPHNPYSRAVFISAGHYEQPRLARLLRRLGQFWMAEWRWIIGTVLAIAALLIGL
jgi:hypothetical protein